MSISNSNSTVSKLKHLILFIFCTFILKTQWHRIAFKSFNKSLLAHKHAELGALVEILEHHFLLKVYSLGTLSDV